MKGKVVVITGATSGIGEVAAQKLAAMGARIVLAARNPARGEKTLARLPSLGAGGVLRADGGFADQPAGGCLRPSGLYRLGCAPGIHPGFR